MKSSDGGLRKIWRDRVVGGWHWQSVETGSIGQGVPDMNYCALAPYTDTHEVGLKIDVPWRSIAEYGHEGWIENKWTDGWVVDLSPEQVAWITRRVRMGGLVSVAVRRRCSAGPRRVAADELYLFRGSHARVARDLGLRPFSAALVAAAADTAREALLYRGEGGPARWDWVVIRAALLRRPDPWRDELAPGG